MPTFLIAVFRRQRHHNALLVQSLPVTEVRGNSFQVPVMHLSEAASSDNVLPHTLLISLTHHSHTRRLLSSDVLTNLRFSSTKVMVLTAPRWRSYSCTTSLVRMSHWRRDRGGKPIYLVKKATRNPSKLVSWFVSDSLLRPCLLKCCKKKNLEFRLCYLNGFTAVVDWT